MVNKDVIQVEIFGISLSSSLASGGYAVILKEVEGERRLPIIIGQYEAQAIALQLEGINPPRPLTHDLLKNVIEILGFSIDSVVINELRDSTFYAKIRLDNDTIDDIDARPSDAIALALKFDAPIFCSSYILDEIGFNPEPEKVTSDFSQPEVDKFVKSEDPAVSRAKKLDQLKRDLDDAVEKEEYEKAATLRDEIKNIEISNN